MEPSFIRDSVEDSTPESSQKHMSSPKVLPLNRVHAPTRASGVLLSLTEVCARLRVPAQYVYLMTELDWLRTVPVGRRLKYLSWEVESLAGWGITQAGGLAGALNSGAAPSGAKGRYLSRFILSAVA